MQGIRERGDMFFATRAILFTGATRLAYEQELKRFIDYSHNKRGKTENSQIDKKDFRSYMEARIAQGGAKAVMNKIRAAIVKFGALYGKWESFHALSKKLGEKIRELARAGQLRGPARPHVSPEVRAAVIDRLRHLDALAGARKGEPRGYALALELQKEGSLRSIEAAERFTRQSLLGLDGDKGRIAVLGKGGKVRVVLISKDLYARLEDHFKRSKGSKPCAAARLPGRGPAGYPGRRRPSHRDPFPSADVGRRTEERQVQGSPEGRQDDQEGFRDGGRGRHRAPGPFP
jgi:site-specific recombinase XerC